MACRERRLRGFSALVLATVCAAFYGTQACAGGQTGSEGARSFEGGPSGGIGGQGGFGPGTGGSGFAGGNNNMYSCGSDAECSARLQSFVDDLRTPRTHAPLRLVAADCETRPAECPGTTFCQCKYTMHEGSGVIPGVVGLGLSECDVSSRTTECLLSQHDFPGCSNSDACPCFDACTHAMATMEDDDKRAFDAEARSATCVNSGCRMVFRVADRCLAGREPGPYDVYDCSLSDDEILSRAFPTSAGTTTPGVVCDAGVCTGRSTSGGCLIAIGVCNTCYVDAAALTCPSRDGG
jgi:hypothetical protein